MAKPNYDAKGSDITKDNWRIVATNRKWNQLSRNEKSPFYEQVWDGKYKTVQWSDEKKAEENFTEWKTTLSQDNIEKVDKYRKDALSDYVYDKSGKTWDKVNYLDKRLFPGGEAEFKDWQKEASKYQSPTGPGTPPWYAKLLDEYGVKTKSESNQMSKIADAKTNTEAKNLALKDNKITNKEAKDLEAKGVSLEKIEELRDQAAQALKKALRIEALSDGRLTKSEIDELKGAGVPQDKIDEMKKNLPLPEGVEVQEKGPTVVGDDGEQGSKPSIMLPDETKFTGSLSEMAEAAGADATTDWLESYDFKWSNLTDDQKALYDSKEEFAEGKVEKDFFNTKLTKDGVQDALKSYSAKQLLHYYDKGKLDVGKNALLKIQEQADIDEGEVEIGGLRRVMSNRHNKSEDSVQYDKGTPGIYYKTYDSGPDKHILKIGNLRMHRPEGGTPHQHIKMVDYDASIRNYDPTRNASSFVTDYKKHSGKVTFKDFKVSQLSGTKMSDIRTKERVEDYRKRGLITDPEHPHRITESATVKTYKTMKDGKVDYVDVQTDERGNLKQLSFDGSVSTAKFPKELSDADSWSAGIGKETSFFDKVNTRASARNSMATIASTKSRGRALLQGIANN